jgi:hypothetical protein
MTSMTNFGARSINPAWVRMRIAVKLSPNLAAAFQSPSSEDPELLSVIQDVSAGTGLQRMHPDSDDPELARWYQTEVGNEHDASVLAETLLATDGVDAAYVQPDVAPP